MGIFEAVGAAGFLFYEAPALRQTYVGILLTCLAYDALIIHMPFSELDRSFEREMYHFTSDVAIAGALLMSGGFRDLTV